MKTLEQNSNATYQGIIAAGFKLDEGRFSLKNDLGVSLDEFLQTIGFTKTIEPDNNKTWVTFRKEDVDFRVSYRNPEEREPIYATMAMIK